MTPSTGTPLSRIVQFGKAPAKRDKRNLQLSTILKAPPKLPAEYDFDVQHNGIPTPMFANDYHGDCVIAGRAHQTLRFEDAEQKKILPITDTDVLNEWHKENGGTENGLSVLDSLKLWRTKGWKAAGKTYKIKLFAEIDRKNHDEVKRTVYADVGCGLGFALPDSALPEFHAGKPWTQTTGPAKQENGHYVYVPGYTATGPVGVTWGRKQQMSWAFFEKYCDEAYAVIDAADTVKKQQLLNEKKVDAFLAGLKKK
jgi:hypothetical protein